MKYVTTDDCFIHIHHQNHPNEFECYDQCMLQSFHKIDAAATTNISLALGVFFNQSNM